MWTPNEDGKGMDPVTISALISAATAIGGKFLPGGDEDSAAENAKADRKLSRQEMLIKLIMEAAKIRDQNAYDANRAKVMAPLASMRMESRMAPPKQTEIRNAATGRMNAAAPGGGDPGVASLVTSNFQKFAAERAKAKAMGAGVTPESLYTPQTDPLEAVKAGAPEAYMDMAGMQKYENKSGDGLDDIEVQMLNKAVAMGRTPEDIGKMLKTFRAPGVTGGVKSNG